MTNMSYTAPLAHSGGHLLADHLHSVARLARQFAQASGHTGSSAGWTYLAGLWHDRGKYRPGFQRYLHQPDNLNINRHAQ